jgi:hypothetical protein
MKNVLTNLFPFPVNAEVNGKRILTRESYNNRIRARILPKPNRTIGLFAPDTITWLRSCATESICPDNDRDSKNQTLVFTMPILGITNRPLPGYKKGGFNLFKTIATVIVSDNVKNFDQCTIEFSSRFPLSVKDFNDELSRQICFAGRPFKKKGRLVIYAHSLNNAALPSDLEALRLCALKTMPVINIDWLDTNETWELIWNPCSKLKPLQIQLEKKLVKFLDRLIEQVCASRCNVIFAESRSFIDSIYLPYRSRIGLPALNKVDGHSSSTLFTLRDLRGFNLFT